MISIQHVSKSYPVRGISRHFVFRDFSLDLPENTNIGIIGRNGAGKTTLLRLIGRVERPDAGEIYNPHHVSPPLGLTSGTNAILTGRENSKFLCRLYGDDSELARARIGCIQDVSELGAFFDRPVKTYSSGMRARLGFAMSMAFEFDYYLIDELTSVGDLGFRNKAAAAFDAKRGKASVIMVSHSMSKIMSQCERGVVLHRGQPHLFDNIEEAVKFYEDVAKST